MKRLTFNTNRTYTAKGQRIAAEQIDGGVYFVDIDRGVNGFIPNCPLEYSSIMARYDKGENIAYIPPSMDSNSAECAHNAVDCITVFNCLKAGLEEMAKKGFDISYGYNHSHVDSCTTCQHAQLNHLPHCTDGLRLLALSGH